MSETLQQQHSTTGETAVPVNLRTQAWALSLLRAVAGFTFAIYGAQLLFGFFSGSGGTGTPQTLFSLLWFAGVLEFFGGLLIGFGLLTRPVALFSRARWRLRSLLPISLMAGTPC